MSKTLITEQGPVRMDTPRDQAGTSEPQIVRKRQWRFGRSTTRSSPCIAGGPVDAGYRGAPEIYCVKVGRDRQPY